MNGKASNIQHKPVAKHFNKLVQFSFLLCHMIKIQQNIKMFKGNLKEEVTKRVELLINNKKCNPWHHMEARLLHLIIKLSEKIEREKNTRLRLFVS